MPSKTEICNFALMHIGITKQVANVDTENSQEAISCRIAYNFAVEKINRDIQWPFLYKQLALGLIEENPTDDYAYSYRYPDDCSKIIGINPSQSNIQYQLSSDDAGRIILTNEPSVILNYIKNADDPQIYPNDFVVALSYLIGFFVAPGLTGGDPTKLRDFCFQQYEYQCSIASRNAFNEQNENIVSEGEFMGALEY